MRLLVAAIIICDLIPLFAQEKNIQISLNDVPYLVEKQAPHFKLLQNEYDHKKAKGEVGCMLS